MPFVLTDQEGSDDTPRALIRVQAAPFIAKEQVRAIIKLRQHQIVVTPMGTVFPISSTEWTALRKFLPQPPEIVEGEGGALPPGFAWSQRAKGVLQMPGGYGGYLTSLRKVCAVVAEERPAPLEPHEQRQQHAICADSLPVQPFTATRRRPKTGCETRM